MFSIKRFLSKPEPVVILGRWTLHHNPILIDLKVDFSNEDHCGACSALVQKESNTTNDDDHDQWVYIAGTVLQ